MKLFISATAISAFLCAQAMAGNIVFEAPVEEEVMMEEAVEPMGSSAAGWIVPVLALIAIGIAISDDDDAVVDGENPGLELSDQRLKTAVERVGTSPSGLGVYQWSYIGHEDIRFEGVLAQEVLAHTPSAVILKEGGYYAVDYAQIDVEMKRLN